jgi:hypothetical protein
MLEHMTRATTLALALLCAGLAGCGATEPIPDARTGTQHAMSGSDADAVTRDGERPEDLATVTVDTEAAQAAASYALASATWSADTYDRQYRRMIDLAAGELRDDLVSQPPERSQIDSLKANRQTSRAKLLAADPRAVHDGRGTVIVVLEQRAGANGSISPRPSNVIYAVGVRRVDGAWRVTRFETLLPG